MKQVGKIYSAVDAEELEAGDIVQVGSRLSDFEDKSLIYEIKLIYDGTYINRFCVGTYSFWNLAKLICPKKHAGIYWAFKNGAKVERYCDYDPCEDCYEDSHEGKWLLDNNPTWAEDEEFRIVEPAHDNSELPEGLAGFLKKLCKGGKMTKYEELMNKSDEYCRKAIQYAKKQDWCMARFYKNASIRFKEKALNLTIEQAEKIIEN